MFDPKEFINVSICLSKAGLSEAKYRTAISRALYGVFLWAREELDSRDEKVKAMSDEERPYEHSKVRYCFKQGTFSHDGVSHRLGGLYKLRYRSDYDLDITIQQSDVEQALEYVQYIQNAFETTLFVRPPDNI